MEQIQILLFLILFILVIGFWGIGIFLWPLVVISIVLVIWLFVKGFGAFTRWFDKTSFSRGLLSIEKRFFEPNSAHTRLLDQIAYFIFGLMILSLLIALVWSLFN